MRVWFTADTHFGHGNIIRYCNRPFLNIHEAEMAATDPRGKWRVSRETVQRHDEALLDAINTHVGRQDILWVVGDFCWGKLAEAQKYRNRILCQNVYLIWGNHDHRSVGSVFTEAFEQVMVTVEGQDIWLNHYPARSWNGRFHGVWHLYGHVHGRLAAEDDRNPSWLTKDVGVDACEYRPWSFEELRTYLAPRATAFQKQKEAFLNGADVDVG